MSFGQEDEIIEAPSWGAKDELIEAPFGASSAPELLDFLTGSPRTGYEQSNISKMIQPFVKSTIGLGAAGADILGGMLKFPSSRVAALVTKVMRPNENLEDIRNAADYATEKTFPSVGNTLGVENTPGYQVPMYPFKKLGEGIDYLGNKVINSLGPDIGGGSKIAMDIGSMLLPIPGVKYAKKGFSKIIETLDPTIKKTESNVDIASIIKDSKFKSEQPQGTLFVDPDGSISPELAARIKEDPTIVDFAKEKARQLEQQANGRSDIMYSNKDGYITNELSSQIQEPLSNIELAKTQQSQQLQQIVKETELPTGQQQEILGENNPYAWFSREPEQIPIDFSFKEKPQEKSQSEFVIDKPLLRSETNIPGNTDIIPYEDRIPKTDTLETPRSPQTIEAKGMERVKAQILSKVAPEASLKEWLDVNTLEEALSLSDKEKDINGGIASRAIRNLASGIHGVTIMNGHPILRYTRKLVGDARGNIAEASQRLITNNKDGLGTKIQNLSNKESIGIMKALIEGDRQQFRLNNETIDKFGFNENQKKFIEKYYNVSDSVFSRWNQVREQLGFKPVKYREGWFPGVFKGNYKTLVWDRAGSEGKIIGFIGQDTKLSQKKAIEYYKKNYPGAVIGTMTHQGLGKSNKVDSLSGLNDILNIISNDDVGMKKLLNESKEANKLINNNLFGIGKHALEKKGIIGNEGNKPWLSEERNAKEALKSMVEYFEAAIEHHEVQVPLHEIDKIVKDPNFTHENVKQYLQQYSNHIQGITSGLGGAVNTLIDRAFDAMGLGTNIPMKGLIAIKNGMSRMFMGFNAAFMAAQAVQPFQMAFPLAASFSKRMGLLDSTVANAMGKGSVWATAENMAKWYDNPKLSIAPEYIKNAIKYATDRGLYAFNELEASHKATENKYIRGFGKAADFTISTGDKMTKLPTYLGFVELFKEGGIDGTTAFALAEKATESSMVNYHPFERPMMYQKMGVIGNFAGGLTTFKHANVNLQAKLVQEAFGQQKNIKPLLYSGMVMLLTAGITGLPAYGELDTLYSKVSEMLNGKPHSIREDFLQKLPELLKSGVISAVANLNLQAKWSAADMIPDTLGKALSPHLEGAYQIGEAAAMYAKDPSIVNRNNLLMKLTPVGVKGFTEEAVMKDPQGRVLGTDGLPKFDSPRSESDWAKRKYTGVSLLNETIDSADLHQDRQTTIYQNKQISDLSKQIKKAYIGKEYARATTLINKYQTIAGPEATQQLVERLGSTLPMETNTGARTRAQGLPKSIRGVERYKEYNDGQ